MAEWRRNKEEIRAMMAENLCRAEAKRKAAA
jgi:hypothetical protein